MLRFLFRRLIVAVPTLFVVITVAFFMMRAAPGGPFSTDRKLPPAIEKNIEKKFHFDEPLYVQYGRYLGGVLHGDFGPSLKYRDKTVLQLLEQNFRPSLTIGAAAFAISIIVGLTVGVTAAMRRNQAFDSVAMGVAIFGVCIPSFVTAPLLQLLLASKLGWLPTGGWNNGAWMNLVIPVTVLALPQVAVISRLTRAGMIEVLHSNYIRTARAKGLPDLQIVIRHALRAAVLPLVSYLGPACAGLITGSLIVENVSGLPGLGKFFVISALQRDYTVVMGLVIIYAALILVLNLAADLLLAALDPRVRLS
jgi:oligopeptide transport system permease protein